MRLIEAIAVAWVWLVVIAVYMTKGLDVSNDMQFLSLAIVVAGALAGKD